MRRRTLLALVATLLAAALALPAAAFGIQVHLRVEGAGATIFGASEPLVTPFTGTLQQGGVMIDLDEPTALGALEAASAQAEFFYQLVSASFGPYISQIGRNPAVGASGWVYKVNGVSPPVGADAYVLEEGDEVLWYWATFGESGGPKTLDLVRRPRGCFRALEVDDAGASTQARNVIFRLDGRAIRSAGGQICPADHWHALRVTKAGFVRSQALAPS